MPRAPRIEFAGAIYHVMNRGDHREKIFHDDQDRFTFLKTLREVCQSAGWWVHSFVLMPNHYHLLIETPRATLVKGMQYLNGTYTQRYNSRYRERGHLFQGRYKALLVDAENECERRFESGEKLAV
jgi:REP element-mobilizing transposase RayT